MQRSKWLSLLVLSTVLSTAPAFAKAAAPTLAAEKAAARVQASLSQNDQTFQAGPGIAITETDAGRVQGFIKNGIYSYYGIPYAEATHRFEAAKPVKPWRGIRMATQVGPISPQAQGNFPNGEWGEPGRSFTMDNNCLNLNVWTPNPTDGKKRPVMVWLHGGGFESGSSLESPAYDGANLSRRGDVVVVSVNHRLNLAGHFNLEKYGPQYKDSANIGIVDLMTAPSAKGLFQKGIVESGAVESMGPYVMSKAQSEKVTDLTLKELGVTKDNLERLQKIPYETLDAASRKALKTVGTEYKVPQALGTGYGLSWEPVVDGDFLPTNPVTETGFAEAGRNVPLLIGTNLTEWTGFQDIVNAADRQYDNKNTWTDAEVEKRLKQAYGDKKDAVVSEFLKAYPDKKKADALYIDTLIRQPILKIMRRKAAQGGAPVYAYLFSWESPLMGGTYMSYHTAEIPFVFHNVDRMLSRTGGSKEAHILENCMSDAWIHFARYGTPQTDALPKWDAYTKESGATMIFDNKIRLARHHDGALLKLLDPGYTY